MNKYSFLIFSCLVLFSCRDEAADRAKYAKDIEVDSIDYINQLDTLKIIGEQLASFKTVTDGVRLDQAMKDYEELQRLVKAFEPATVPQNSSLEDIDAYYAKRLSRGMEKLQYMMKSTNLWNTLEAPYDTMRKAVMDIHDDAMAKYGAFTELEVQISAAVDSTNQGELKEATQTIIALRKADENMMAWMRQFKDPLRTTVLDSVKRYFNTQLISIQAVKEETDTSIKKAKTLLEKIK